MPAVHPDPDSPNVIVITSHDTGRHFGCYGVGTVQSPHIDSLAADAHLFTNCFTTSPVCSPSRGAFLTGRYPQSNGLMGLTHTPWEWTFSTGERHLSHMLRDAGYHTALFGIQHESPDVTTLGFEEVRENTPAGTPHRSATSVAESVDDFLRNRTIEDGPYFAQIGFFETHRPFDFEGAVPDQERGVFVPPYLESNDVAIGDLAALQGAIRKLDDAVGRIVLALEKSGQDENTLLIFTTDHGIEFPRAKWFLYDPGIAVTLMMRWPARGIVGGQRQDRLTSNIDVLPTILDLIGLPVPGNVEGMGFSSGFGNDAVSHPRDAVFAMYQSAENRCIRTSRYKFIRNFVPRRRLEVPVDMASPTQRIKQPVVELYDLGQDPYEFRNLADDSDYQHIRGDLSERLWRWLEEVDDPILRGPVPTPYYHQAMSDYATTT